MPGSAGEPLQAVLSSWTLSACTAAACLLASLLLASLLLGVAATWVVASLHRRWRRAARQLALVLLVPGIVLAVRPERLAVAQGPAAGAMLLILGVLPVLMLPVLSRLAGMLDGQVRTASGLGAGRIAILRLVWLPQLGWPVLLGTLLSGLLDLVALALRR